jgi:hypothetical protein
MGRGIESLHGTGWTLKKESESKRMAPLPIKKRFQSIRSGFLRLNANQGDQIRRILAHWAIDYFE